MTLMQARSEVAVGGESCTSTALQLRTGEHVRLPATARPLSYVPAAHGGASTHERPSALTMEPGMLAQLV